MFFLLAEVASIDVQYYKLSHSFDTLLLEEAFNPKSFFTERGLFLGGIGVNYSNNLLSLFNQTTSKTEKTLVQNVLGLDLHLGFLFKKRFYLGFSGDFRQVVLGESRLDKNGQIAKKEAWVFSDPKVVLKIRLTPQDVNYAVSVIPFFGFKVGDPVYYATDNSWIMGSKIAFDYYFDQLFIVVNGGYQYAQEAKLPEEITGNETTKVTSAIHKITYGLGGGYFFNPLFSLHSELQGVSILPFDLKYQAIDWLLFTRIKFNTVALYLGGAFRGIQNYQESSKDSVRINWRAFVALRGFFGFKEKTIAPKTEPVVEAPVIVQEVKKDPSPLGTVFFGTNQANLTSQAQETLKQIADNIRSNYSSKLIVLEGHTDSRGSLRHHEDLSRRRAQSVENFLKAQGVDNSLEIRFNATPKVLVAEDLETGSGLSENRCVEIYVLE